jgi:hypothetical protein
MSGLLQFGGDSNGTSTSNATQLVNTYFLPTLTTSPQPLVSSAPVGQGLSTINIALPSSAALAGSNDTTGNGNASTPVMSSTASDALLFAALGVALWFVLRNKNRA